MGYMEYLWLQDQRLELGDPPDPTEWSEGAGDGGPPALSLG